MKTTFLPFLLSETLLPSHSFGERKTIFDRFQCLHVCFQATVEIRYTRAVNGPSVAKEDIKDWQPARNHAFVFVRMFGPTIIFQDKQRDIFSIIVQR